MLSNMKEGMDVIAELIAIAAKSSPSSLNESFTDISILDEAEKEMLVEEMYQMADEKEDETYTEVSEDIEQSEKVILIGLDDHHSIGLDCKACGYESCEILERSDQKKDIFEGPNCLFKVMDIGTSLGYALQSANRNNVYASISIKGGLAAKNLGLSTSRLCVAIQINTKSKEFSFGI